MGTAGGPHDDLPLGSTVRSRTRETVPSSSLQPATTPGAWMKPPSRSKGHGRTSTGRLIPTHDTEAAKRFFVKALHSRAGSAPGARPVEESVVGPNTSLSAPRVITVEKHAAYPKAMAELKAAGMLPEQVELRQVKYLNNLIEQDHRFIKRLVKPGMGFFSFESAWRTLQG